jgi:hypothetical protein
MLILDKFTAFSFLGYYLGGAMNQGAQELMGDNLKVVLPKFSSFAIFLTRTVFDKK